MLEKLEFSIEKNKNSDTQELPKVEKEFTTKKALKTHLSSSHSDKPREDEVTEEIAEDSPSKEPSDNEDKNWEWTGFQNLDRVLW